MITVHHLENSRSQRVLWLLEELGLEYEVKRYPRDPDTMLAPEALKQVHPLGKSPIVVDGERVLVESGAIIEYLVDTHGNGQLRPEPGTPQALSYTFWLHYAEGSLMPPLLLKLLFDTLPRRLPLLIRPASRIIALGVKRNYVTPQLQLHLDYLEECLEGREWFVGDEFTAADIQLSFPLEGAAARGALDRSRPQLWDFLRRIQQRPAYQRALERGGPYQLKGLGGSDRPPRAKAG